MRGWSKTDLRDYEEAISAVYDLGNNIHEGLNVLIVKFRHLFLFLEKDFLLCKWFYEYFYQNIINIVFCKVVGRFRP